jgi:hypothetical protein
MSGGVVCYVQRVPGGGGIRSLRLIAAGLAREWTAPEGRAVSSIDGGAGSAVIAAHAGAQWISETLDSVGLKRLAALCLDAEGSICTWISSTSADPSVVKATMVQAGVDGDGSGAGVGAARLLAMADGGGSSGGGGGVGVDTSVQALATLEPEVDGPKGLSLKKKAPAQLPRKQRLAVLAVQDAVARVLLDELDRRGIETERVVSIWHAMAAAWDRSQSASLSDRLVSAHSPGGAVILVEPTGRLVWAWTRAGELVAGGTMRLSTRSRAAEESASEALAVSDSATRPIAPELPGSSMSVDFTAADAGRIAVDWLSWSAQLGHCPERVVCLSVPTLGDPEKGSGMGPEALFANLARAWPGATIDGAVHEDPIGATLARLAGLGPEDRTVTTTVDPRDELPYHARPREALADLTARPGKADRRLHQWIGVSLCAAAALTAVVGWQLGQSANLAQAELEKAKKDRADAITSAAATAGVTNLGRNPTEALEGALKKVRDQNKSLKPPRPILEETVRVLTALHEVDAEMKAAGASPATSSTSTAAAPSPDVDAPLPDPASSAAPSAAAKPHIVMTDLEISQVAAKATFMVPDAATGPSILLKVQEKVGLLRWDGMTPGSAALNQPRQYTLLAPWPADDAKPSAPAPAAAKPAPTPATPAKPAEAKKPDDKKPDDKKPEPQYDEKHPGPPPDIFEKKS